MSNLPSRRKRRSDQEIVSQLLNTVKKNKLTYTVHEISEAAGLDYKTARRWFKVFITILEIGVLPIPIKEMKGVYITKDFSKAFRKAKITM